ncbi:MAG TPA: phytanoyl-CoA dioxygenase family protein [Candidatus Latescibacteria bacterium]|jgi:hypothetical protein|nr:hypothetical protein [Gemmatimonadota bacterium]MDP7362545.1 phytanoyl-CoA dioxygenase family protein [Candidatus Latescibacterota bacterium]MDP7631891.1 phytanoyl-CoA dioxygenase family protein [Candidatus Latescibacterota bacterium]MED5413929.1 phytanoyl-CoA dioxygenase family protein [Candidatus Latescibacterota bacterium]HCV24928.1 hypothetical protein [Candidatus Latescibacterota bacterium]|tara:strand:- start:144 stop:983 length:840 start_codon:yes stop_codon:yes gene_type:complete
MSSKEPVDPFRRQVPTAEDLDDFHRDGYIAFYDAMTDSYREALIEEVLSADPVRSFLDLSDEERSRLDSPTRHFVRPWNDRGPLSDALIDAPLITALLRETVGPDVHFCHSSMNLALRGAERGEFHQDHHHWNHHNPINIAERDRYYIQVLYYPNGFARGDRSLVAIPGSHLVAPTPDVTPAGLLSGEFDEQAGRKLQAVDLELPPGSFIYLNARMFHGIQAKPIDSPQAFRIFLIDIFKEEGPPHRFTQEIPRDWLERATPERCKLYEREPFTETCWS